MTLKSQELAVGWLTRNKTTRQFLSSFMRPTVAMRLDPGAFLANA